MDIGAPAWDRHVHDAVVAGLNTTAERFQDADLFRYRNIHAAQAQHPRRAQGQGAVPVRLLPGDHQLAGLAAADLQDQAGRDLGAGDHEGGIDAALEAVARVAVDRQLAAGLRRADGIEQGHFKEHVGRRLGDAGALAAHDGAQADHAAIVGDHGHAGFERVFLAVQRHQRLAGLCRTDGQAALQLAGIEHVQRTRDIEGQQIGDIDQRRDRPQADRQQPVLKPARAGAVLHAPDQPADEHRAGRGLVFREVEGDADRAGELARHRRGVDRLQRPKAGGRQVAGDAAHPGAIRPVRRQGDVDQRIVKAQHATRRERRRARPRADR